MVLKPVSGAVCFSERTSNLFRQVHKFTSLFFCKIDPVVMSWIDSCGTYPPISKRSDPPSVSSASRLLPGSLSLAVSPVLTAAADSSAGSSRSKYFLRRFAWYNRSLPSTLTLQLLRPTIALASKGPFHCVSSLLWSVGNNAIQHLDFWLELPNLCFAVVAVLSFLLRFLQLTESEAEGIF